MASQHMLRHTPEIRGFPPYVRDSIPVHLHESTGLWYCSCIQWWAAAPRRPVLPAQRFDVQPAWHRHKTQGINTTDEIVEVAVTFKTVNGKTHTVDIISDELPNRLPLSPAQVLTKLHLRALVFAGSLGVQYQDQLNRLVQTGWSTIMPEPETTDTEENE